MTRNGLILTIPFLIACATPYTHKGIDDQQQTPRYSRVRPKILMQQYEECLKQRDQNSCTSKVTDEAVTAIEKIYSKADFEAVKRQFNEEHKKVLKKHYGRFKRKYSTFSKYSIESTLLIDFFQYISKKSHLEMLEIERQAIAEVGAGLYRKNNFRDDVLERLDEQESANQHLIREVEDLKMEMLLRD